MKKRNVILCLILCFVCAFSIFGLVGCGDVPIETVDENFSKLQEIYDKNDTVFVKTKINPSDPDSKKYYVVDFGIKEDVMKRIISRPEDFTELESLYNVDFAISNDYIFKNFDYVLLSAKQEMSSQARKKLNELNENIVSYTNQIDTFLGKRRFFVDIFKPFEEIEKVDPSQIDKTTNDEELKRFKIAFGELIEKNNDLAIKMAEVVEATNIYEALEKSSLTSSDTEILKNVIRAKMLPVFTDTKIVEFANKMAWAVQAEGDCKKRINDLLGNLTTQYENFKQTFVFSTKNYKTLTAGEDGEFAQLRSLADEFFVEANAYSKALTGVNFEKLAEEYDNNLKEYSSKNKFVEVYLEKMEQFINIVLPKFITEVEKLIYV